MLACLLHACTPQQSSSTTSEPAVLPRAEWDKAQAILMHTPGEELFCGSINPYAGLFEYYFDVDSAAMEHKQYIASLEANGIKVHTIHTILQNAPIEDLRTLAANILVYDVNMLSEEDANTYTEYRESILQQMSRNDLIKCILQQPTVKLNSTTNNTGVEAKYYFQPLMNLYFTRDQSITTPQGTIICKMNSTQRERETHLLQFCYQQIGITPLLYIQGAGRLEGGDYIPAGHQAFIGCGMRTNMDAIEQIMNANAFGHDTIVVVNDHKWWQLQMHLDTYFNIIDKDLCTLVESRYTAQEGEPEWVTVDIYTRPDAASAYQLTQKNLPFVSYLQDCGYEIIPIKWEDELHYANNYLTIAPRHIMAVANQSKELEETLAAHNVKVEWIQLENCIKGYGAAHCMTQVLARSLNH